MFKNKPVTLLIASGLMIVLVVLVGILPLFGRIRGFGMNPGRQFNGQRGQFQRNLPDGATLPNSGIPPQGFTRGDGTSTQGGFTGAMPSGNMGVKIFQLMRGVQIVGGILLGLLGILSIVGMWLNKKWGRVWAVVTSILIFLITIPNLLRGMFGLSMVETLVKVTFAVAIIVLCLLPKSRQVVVAA
jgi:hypothetical protein